MLENENNASSVARRTGERDRTSASAATPERATQRPAEYPSERRKVRQNQGAIVWFFGCLSILACAMLLQVGGGRAVQIPWLDWKIPETCGLRWRFGIDCPGCGLTRSFIAICDGDIAGAWSLNWVGVFIFAYVVMQIPISLAVWTRIKHERFRSILFLNQVLLIAFPGLLAVRWLFRLCAGELL